MNHSSRRARVSRGWAAVALVAAVSISAQSALGTPLDVSALYDQETIFENTNSLRSLALSQDGSTLYSGWLHGADARAVYKHDALVQGAIPDAYPMGTIQPNSLATDDRGNVYIGYGENGNGGIEIVNGSFASVAAAFNGGNTSDVEGLSVWKDLSGAPSPPAYYLYASRRDGTIQRFDVTDPTSPALDTGWASSGTYAVPGAGTLRGMEVAADGTIFLAQRDTASGDRLGFVYSIPPSLGTLMSVPLSGAMDVAIYDDELYVSTYRGLDSTVEVLSTADLLHLATYEPNIPRVGDVEKQEDLYGYSGIDISDDGQLYLGDQWYMLYRIDPGGKQHADRILTHPPIGIGPEPPPEPVIPEPATLLVLGMGCLALARRRKGA